MCGGRGWILYIWTSNMRVILRGYEPTVVFGLGQWESRHDNLFQRQAVNYPMSWLQNHLSTQESKFKDLAPKNATLGWNTLQDTQMAI